MKLLIVDDEPRNLDVLEGHLAPLGHEVVRAVSGREALAIIDAGGPNGIDLVLLDVMMPGLDGIDVLVHLRARPAGAHLPVVLVTALNDRAARLRGLEAGADEFLEKPVDAAVLRARVTTLLRLKQAVDDLEQRNNQMERLQRLQRDLTRFIVHDLKSPMGVVQANVEYALLRLGERGDSEVGEALQDAEDAAKRLRAMIEDLLLVASSEEAQLPVRRQRVAVRPLLEEVRRRHARAATERNVSLDIVATGGEEVAADRVLLSRALDNLVDNALRYTPRAGRVEMAAHVAGEAIFTVSNTGRAIPASERASLFEKYARVVDTQSGRSARVGPGLGLHFCRRAAEAHGGQIDVVETEDWPNRFVLRVPPATDAAASVQEHG